MPARYARPGEGYFALGAARPKSGTFLTQLEGAAQPAPAAGKGTTRRGKSVLGSYSPSG